MDSVKTTGVGFAPILKHYFERCGIEKIIDQNVDLDPRSKVLTHGQVCIAMITSIMFQTMQLYKICQFADRTTIFPVCHNFAIVGAMEIFIAVRKKDMNSER
jgi:hypothetical protein